MDTIRSNASADFPCFSPKKLFLAFLVFLAFLSKYRGGSTTKEEKKGTRLHFINTLRVSGIAEIEPTQSTRKSRCMLPGPLGQKGHSKHRR
jgi:hypothetical protein